MKTVMNITVSLFFFLYIYSQNVYTAPSSGPYDIVVNRLELCDDLGTDEVHFGIRMSSRGHNMKTYTNDVIFNITWDDQIKLDIEGQYLRNGAYIPKYMQQSFKNCERMWKNMKRLTQGFFGAAGYNFTGCPLPAGVYSVKDWVIDIKLNNIPSLLYGSYKIIMTFTKKGQRLGCFSIYADIVPKEA